MKPIRIFLLMLALAGVAAAALAVLPATRLPSLPRRDGPAIASAKVWGYQLQGARPELIAPDIDLVVIDHAREQSATDLLTVADVDAFRRRDGAPPRIVLAYMSIGEAERYRYYWQARWASKASLGLAKPSWLARENKDWKGNYLVRYWESGWQKLIFNRSPSRIDVLRQRFFGGNGTYLDKILEAGFDGVYLDRVDVFGEWEKSRAGAEAEMSEFVKAISAYAKTRKPGFLVVAQNGEELLARKSYRDAIDGAAKEDLLFGASEPEKQNEQDEIRRSVELLRVLQADGKPVFVVEYLKDPTKRVEAQVRLREAGFIVTFADRELNRPPEAVLTQPQPSAPADATAKPQP